MTPSPPDLMSILGRKKRDSLVRPRRRNHQTSKEANRPREPASSQVDREDDDEEEEEESEEDDDIGERKTGRGGGGGGGLELGLKKVQEEVDAAGEKSLPSMEGISKKKIFFFCFGEMFLFSAKVPTVNKSAALSCSRSRNLSLSLW